MSETILEARGIDFDYPGGIAALRDLDLSIVRGRRLAILGPNGAGKTTLLLHLNGTYRPKSGEMLLNGKPGAYTRAGLRDWRSTVGLVLQEADDQLFSASVRQDISFGPLNLGLSEAETRARVEAALSALHLTHVVDRPTHMLSFGQKKRVAIAGIMAMRPAVLVLDEPTAGLDPSGERHLLIALAGLHAAGTTLVFSTHDIEFAWAWADDVALFKDGRVLRQGAAEDILLNDALLAEVGLTPPLVAEIARRLPGRDPAAPLPRRRSELLALLSGA
jgi:cobalt/nickel transport system ATP-binding protein